MTRRVARFTLHLSLIALPAMLQAQTAPGSPLPGSTQTETPRRGAAANFPTNALPSPEVHADRTVTFRLNAPRATQVSLIGEVTGGRVPVPMTRGADGVWTLTIGPLAPEIWIYNFRVDGVDTLDPSNPALKPVPPGQLTSNFVEVPGDVPTAYDAQPVPHGEVRMILYESKTMGFTRTMWVYTPPGYDTGKQRYPVLYLLHGNGEEVSGWVRNGRANIILDNLLAAGIVKPMIVVMPQGHALQAAGVEPLKRITGETSMFSPLFPKELLAEIIPHVEHTFRTKKDVASRAIAGLSMGGGQALSIGLSNPDLFRYVLGYSAAIGPNFLDVEPEVNRITSNARITNQNFGLIWISCGRQDFLYKANQGLHESLEAHGVKHEYIQTEGAHVWSVWRKNLTESLPLLFR